MIKKSPILNCISEEINNYNLKCFFGFIDGAVIIIHHGNPSKEAKLIMVP